MNLWGISISRKLPILWHGLLIHHCDYVYFLCSILEYYFYCLHFVFKIWPLNPRYRDLLRDESRKAYVKIFWLSFISSNVVRLYVWLDFCSLFMNNYTRAVRPFPCLQSFLKKSIETFINKLLLLNVYRKGSTQEAFMFTVFETYIDLHDFVICI